MSEAYVPSEHATFDIAEREPERLPAAPAAKPQQVDYVMAVLDRGGSLEQIEKMMELQERMRRQQAETAYYEGLAAFKSEAIEIIKRKRVYFEARNGGGATDYKHARLSDVIEAVAPALSRHGFGYSWSTKQERTGKTVDWVEVTCTLRHRLGHSESVTLGGPPDTSGNKNPIQQVVSAVSYLERHTLKAITGVAEKDDDDDGRGGPEGAVEPQAPGEPTEMDALVQAGRDIALQGMAPLVKWYGALTKQQQKALDKEYLKMRGAARTADEMAPKGGAK